MENLQLRFKLNGGAYTENLNNNDKQSGGGGNELSPKSENWKKQYLLMKIQKEKLEKEKEKLEKEKKKLQQKIKKMEGKKRL